MELMCTAYAKKETQSQYVSNSKVASIQKGKHTSFVKNILFSLNCLMNPVVKVLLNSFFVGMHF